MPIPKKIVCSDQVFSIDFHPSREFLAAGLVNGCVELWRYSTEGKNAKQLSFSHHQGSCRELQFLKGGDKLVSVSSDLSWKIINETGQVLHSTESAHEVPINRVLMLDDNSVATGDDNGIVKLWDIRDPSKSVMSWDVHTDFITNMLFHAESNQLFTSSGDATLGVYDIRIQKNFYKSDDQESEIHCLQLMRHGKKLVCGTQEGVTLFFNWGQWGDCSDRYLGQTESINCFHKVDESTLLYGSSDGLIQAVNILPNRILGPISDQKDASVENMKADNTSSFIGTTSLDECIRFADLSVLQDDEDGDEEEEEGDDDDDEEDEGEVGPEISGEENSVANGDDDSKGVIESESDSESEGEDSSDGDGDDEENEDGQDKESDAQDEDSSEKDSDSDGDSDDSGSDKHTNKKPRRLPTAREQFYADL